MPTEAFRISMSDLRDKFLRVMRNGAGSIGVRIPDNVSAIREYTSVSGGSFYSRWAGATSADFGEWLTSGYAATDVPELDTSAIPVRKKKRARFNDCEGDFRYDLFTAGDENCFMEWSKREAIPGVHVQFFFGFTADVSAKTIQAYTEWLLGAFTTLEANGVDCSISAFNRGQSRFAGYEYRGKTTEFHIDVKREGERNDFVDWSALFAPGSYRILGFFAIALQAESLGKSTQVGGSTGDKWGVKLNPETRVIEIMADSIQDYGFPRERMTNELSAAIAAARGN